MDYIAEPATDMSHTSDWPLPADSLRLPIPAALLEKLAVHPLSRDLYPTSLGHYRRARDHRMSRERHDEHLLIYCSEGQGLLRVREGDAWREYRVGSGDLLWLPPGMAHDYAADDRQPWTIFWTHLRGDSATWLQHSAGYRDTPLRHWGLQHALLGGFEQLLEVRHSGYRFQHFLLAASRLRSLLCQLPLLRPPPRPAMFPILRPLLHTAALACALPALAADPQPASGGWAQPDPAPIGYAVLNVSRERVESGTACDVGLYVHDELVGNLQPGASLALNLQPGAVDVRLAPNGPGEACRNGMTILAGQTLTLRAGEIRNLRITLGAGGLYLAPVADGY